MKYAEYKSLRAQGAVVAGVDKSSALHLIKYLPRHYQFAHWFWSCVWLLSIPGFLCVAVFIKWWVGLLLLLLVTPMIFRATKDSAAQFVLAHAEDNEEFFNMLVTHHALVFRPVGG